MNFIGKHISLIGILLLTIFVGAAAGLYFDVPARLQKHKSTHSAKQTYTCPMHPEVVQDHAGNCPKCGMSLILASASSSEQMQSDGCSHEDSGSGCCAKPSSATLTLPPGHPPVEGYTVAPAAECTNHVH